MRGVVPLAAEAAREVRLVVDESNLEEFVGDVEYLIGPDCCPCGEEPTCNCGMRGHSGRSEDPATGQ